MEVMRSRGPCPLVGDGRVETTPGREGMDKAAGVGSLQGHPWRGHCPIRRRAPKARIDDEITDGLGYRPSSCICRIRWLVTDSLAELAKMEAGGERGPSDWYVAHSLSRTNLVNRSQCSASSLGSL